MLSPKSRRNIIRIIPFAISWLIFGGIYTILERGLLGELNYYPITGNSYIFKNNAIVIPSFALLAGIVNGILEIFYFSKWFINERFTRKIAYKFLIYLLIISSFLVIILVFTANNIPATIIRKDFWLGILAFFTNYSFLGVLLYIASVILITQFFTEVIESVGTNKLSNFFLGKYYEPVEEERIFMFLDMKSSTEIAEKLGHLRYFEMLKDYFADLSESVIKYWGEIYQYAGDEMIISWKLQKGLEHNNCISCFFAMKDALSKQKEKYEEKFGLMPLFKAGLHYGKVTTGEIGFLKKEIIFTGDVLNTSARIEALCNHFNVDILVSKVLIAKLHLDPLFKVQFIGANTLRGKNEQIELFTINRSYDS